MTLLESVLMGIIQGVTEFLPVSSSGHLAIFKSLFHVETPGLLFDILLHVGTLLAVFVCYYKDIFKMLAEFFKMLADIFFNFTLLFQRKEEKKKRKIVSNGYRKFDLLVLVTCIPTGIIGVVDSDMVEKASDILLIPGICLIINSVILFVSDRLKDGKNGPKETSFTSAFLIGVAQGIATLPGISRSGTTITACVACGFQRNFAVKYSFILSIPTILGSLLFEITDVDLSLVTANEVCNYAVGMLVAALVGFVCIKTMLVVVRQKKFTYFAVYSLIVGVLSVVGYFAL